MGVDDGYPGMCKARLEVPAHPSAQAASWPNSLGNLVPVRASKTFSLKEKPITKGSVFARFWPTIAVLHYGIYISHTSLPLGSTAHPRHYLCLAHSYHCPGFLSGTCRFSLCARTEPKFLRVQHCAAFLVSRGATNIEALIVLSI